MTDRLPLIADRRLAHDLNNQLCIIIGYAGLLLEDCAGDDQRLADYREIHKAATRALEIVATSSARTSAD